MVRVSPETAEARLAHFLDMLAEHMLQGRQGEWSHARAGGSGHATRVRWGDPPKGRNGMAGLRLEHIYKRFGDSIAVNDVNFDIYDREFLVLVGPSGCGKSTTLRMIAGWRTSRAARSGSAARW
jgi:ABC-type multidrug transport system fused ATPase/permease subunit